MSQLKRINDKAIHIIILINSLMFGFVHFREAQRLLG